MAVITVFPFGLLAVLALASQVLSFSADDFPYDGSRDSIEKSVENEISFRKPEPTRSTRVYLVTNRPHDPSVSLFDLLPNQGAYDASDLTQVRRETTTSKPARSSYNELESFTSRSTTKPTFPPRLNQPQRSTSSNWYKFQSTSTARPFVKARRLTTPAPSPSSKNSKRSFGEIEIEHQPTSDLNVAYFNSHLLAPIVRKLTEAEQRSRNSGTVPILSPNSDGGYNNQGNRPIAEPAFARELQRRLQQNFRQQPSPSYGAPAKPEPSAQSKFFVFTSEPNTRDSYDGYNNKGQGGYSGGYSNSPKPSYGPPAETTTAAPQQPKNEVHYHYHITNNRLDPTSTTTTTTPRPSYGPPSTTTTSAPPAQYGPPPKKTSEGYGGYQESFSNRDGYDGYNYNNNNGNAATRRVKEGAEVRVPILRNNQQYQQYQAPSSFRDETTTTSKPLDYNVRTLFTSLRAPDNTYTAYSNSAEPSPSYGPPEYTTSTTQPPPSDLPRYPPAHTAQTSITLETIPITTTETRFVTVPKIVQTLGTTVPRQPDDFNNPPAAPPQYGPPDSDQTRDRSSTSIGQLPSNVRNIFDAHLAQLNPQPPQVGDLSDADLIALLQQGSRQAVAPPPAPVAPQQSDLRNSFLLGNFRQPGLSIPVQQFQPSAFGLQQNFGLPQAPIRSNVRAPPSSAGSTTVLTGEAVGAVSDIIREQRLQQVISELQGRLRQQNRNIDRNRQSFRNVFLTGAALMAGLTLIPSTALLGGGAAAASAAAASPLISSASLMPFTAGKRRKRSLALDELVIDVPLPIESRPVRPRTSVKLTALKPEAATAGKSAELNESKMPVATDFQNYVKVDQVPHTE